MDYLWCHIDLHFTNNIKQASIYVSSQSKTLFECLHIHISNYFHCCGKTESAKNLTYIYVSHICLSSYPHPGLCLHCYVSLFLFPWKLIPLWLIICHFFANFFPQSIQFWCSPFVQSSLFSFYYFSFHLSSHLYKDSYGNKFFISFLLSWAHNEISDAPTIPRFSSHFTASENQLWLTESGQHLQEQITESFTVLTL